jgi:hypothetical protein
MAGAWLRENCVGRSVATFVHRLTVKLSCIIAGKIAPNMVSTSNRVTHLALLFRNCLIPGMADRERGRSEKQTVSLSGELGINSLGSCRSRH